MTLTKPSDRTIVITRVFDAPRQKVFEALTSPDQLPRWFQPEHISLDTYEADVKSGGSFRYVFKRPSGKKIEMSGVFREVDAPRRWVHTEKYDFSPIQLLVTIVLDESPGKTTMTQTILYTTKEERDGDYDNVADSAKIFLRLDDYLAGR